MAYAPARGHEKTCGVDGLLIGAITEQERSEGTTDDLKVEQRRCVITVPNIKRHLIAGADVRPTVDLRPSGHAGLHSNPIGAIFVQITIKEGPRTDERHLTGENIPDLRKLIKPRTPYKATNGGNS